MTEKYIQDLLKNNFYNHFSISKRRENLYQIFLPLYYPDGDMIDIFIKANGSSSKLTLCDCGLTLMHLSYDLEIDSKHKETIFSELLMSSNVHDDNGNLCLETTPDMLFFDIMQFSQALNGVYNMRILKPDNIKNLFYDNVEKYILTQFSDYSPKKDFLPIQDINESVDYCLNPKSTKPIFIYAVQGKNKALSSMVSMLSFQNMRIPFTSIVIHDNFSKLSNADQKRIMGIADKQFYSYDSFMTDGMEYVKRIA